MMCSFADDVACGNEVSLREIRATKYSKNRSNGKFRKY
jgi:hypothetical protein